jgi:hypothetical protein
LPTTSASAAMMLASLKALLDPANKLRVKGPAIWPAAKAAVIMPTACDACGPATRNTYLMPAMVMTMKLPPTHTAAANKVTPLSETTGANTPAASSHWAAVHQRQGARR